VNRRVLIVTSSYAPAMIADMHRARQLAWELPELGWEVEILAPDATYQPPSCLDDDSADYFASGTRVHQVPAYRPRLFHALRMGGIGWRAYRPMARLGDRLLRLRRFDLVYFSTTQFPLFLLGARWNRRWGVPYVLDFHDPCYRDEPAPPVWARWSIKHEASRRLARHVERRAVNAAAGLVAVSASYLDVLRRRHGGRGPAWTAPGRAITVPFSVLKRDLELARGQSGGAGDARRGDVRIVYVGAGGPVMARAFAQFCRALARLRDFERPLLDSVKIQLYGTLLGWRDGDRRHLSEIAAAHGVGEWIDEDPRRVSYRRSLELLLGGDGALVLGVDDAGYMPSKLFTYALSGKPLLAVVRRDGPAYAAQRGELALGEALWFSNDGDMEPEEAVGALRRFLAAAASRQCIDRRAMLAPFMARAMARRHVELFTRCVEGRESP